MAWPSTSARSKNWGTEILTDTDLENELDLLHTWLNDALNSSSGHKHDGTTSEGPKIIVSNLSLASAAQGDVLYHDGTNLTRLGAGTSGQFLKTQGAAANPVWADVAAAASQTEMEAASSTTVYASPGTVQNHPGVAKVWCVFNGASPDPITPDASYGVSGTIAKGTTGTYTITFSKEFSSANYAVVYQAWDDTVGVGCSIDLDTKNVGSLVIKVYRENTGTLTDAEQISVVIFGDQ